MRDWKSLFSSFQLNATTINRGLSFIIIVIYFILLYPGSLQPMMIVSLLMVLSLIWFGEFWGEATVGMWTRGGVIDQASPGCMVAAMGCFFLVGVPLIIYILSR